MLSFVLNDKGKSPVASSMWSWHLDISPKWLSMGKPPANVQRHETTMSTKRKPFRKQQHSVSGGIRVREFGLIKVLVPATVITGILNTVTGQKQVKAGYVFNSLDMEGDWIDVLPVSCREDNRYFERVGAWVPNTTVERMNRTLEKLRCCHPRTNRHWILGGAICQKCGAHRFLDGDKWGRWEKT
jgi:hypothetical protein